MSKLIFYNYYVQTQMTLVYIYTDDDDDDEITVLVRRKMSRVTQSKSVKQLPTSTLQVPKAKSQYTHSRKQNNR